MNQKMKKIKELFLIEKGSLQSLKNIDGEFDFITASSSWKKHNKYTHNCEAIVIAIGASGSLGRVHYVKGKFISSDLCFILTPLSEYKNNINLSFYYFYFISIRNQLVKSLAKGAAKKAINKKDFGNYEIIFPEIEFQKEISKKLNLMSTKTQNINTNLVGALDYIEKFERFVVEDKQEKISGLTEFTVSDLLIRSKKTTIIEDEKVYKRITIKMHTNGVCLRDELMGKKIGTKKQFFVEDGQFIISKIDARNGAFGIIPIECNNAIITGNFWAYNINKDIVNPEYLSYILTTEKFLDLFKKSSQGMTNRRYLQEDIFLKQRIILPPKINQVKILRKLIICESLKLNIEDIFTNTGILVGVSFNKLLKSI